MRQFDYLIVGQGIAGTTLAWQLRWLAQRVAIIDRDDSNTASKVASGLISPVTGKKHAVSWRFDQLWPNARGFYRRVEAETNAHFLHCRPMLKLVTNATSLVQQSANPYIGPRVRLAAPLNRDLAGVELSPAARLDVAQFLASSRSCFEEDNSYFVADIDPTSDLDINDDVVRVRRLGIFGSKLVFCQGIAAQSNSLLEDIDFESTKGDILTLEIPSLSERRVVSGDVWLAPIGGGLFLAGSTYERDFKDERPSQNAREEILDKLSLFLQGAFRVVDHRAAIRPAVQGRLPLVGLNENEPRIGIFNGLGSKGALRAPFFSEQLAQHLVHGTELIEEVQLRRTTSRAETPKRLTELAHWHIGQALREGDTAIDATVGNGFDTVFLAKCVGPSGRVFGIDKQQQAIDRTVSRLKSEGCQNASLIRGSHEHLTELIPQQHHNRISAIMLNLGYLPRGDKEITTEIDSTVAAIRCGLGLLGPGGVLTVLAYTGHPGGFEEAMAVEHLIAELSPTEFDVETSDAPIAAGPPKLWVVRKK